MIFHVNKHHHRLLQNVFFIKQLKLFNLDLTDQFKKKSVNVEQLIVLVTFQYFQTLLNPVHYLNLR